MNFLENLAAQRQKLLDGIDANEGDINLRIFEDFYPDEAHFIYELLQNAESIRRVLKTCGWIIATEEVCFVSDKHIIAHHDKAGRLHSDNGFALEYADGWGIYAHHGIRIPSQEYHELEHQKKLGLKGQEKLW